MTMIRYGKVGFHCTRLQGFDDLQNVSTSKGIPQKNRYSTISLTAKYLLFYDFPKRQLQKCQI